MVRFITKPFFIRSRTTTYTSHNLMDTEINVSQLYSNSFTGPWVSVATILYQHHPQIKTCKTTVYNSEILPHPTPFPCRGICQEVDFFWRMYQLSGELCRFRKLLCNKQCHKIPHHNCSRAVIVSQTSMRLFQF